MFSSVVLWPRSTFCVATTIVLTIGSAGYAEKTSTSSRRITLKEVEQRAETHPALEAAKQRRRAAEAARVEATAAPNPRLETSVGAAFGKAMETAAPQWGVGFTVPLGWSAGRNVRGESAAAAAAVAFAEVARTRRDLRRVGRELYWRLAGASARARTLRDLTEQSDALVSTVEARVVRGAARPIEKVRVQVEAEAVRGEWMEASALESAHRARLALFLGLPGETPLEVDADLEQISKIDDASALIDMDEHPAAKAARARARAARADEAVARRSRVPDLDIGGFFESEPEKRAAGGTLSLELPLWNLHRGAVRSAEAEVAAADAEIDAERSSRTADTVEATVACRSGTAVTEHYRLKILPLAASAAETAEKSYRLGESALMEVIDARRTLLETRLRFLSSLLQTHLDCTRAQWLSEKETLKEEL